MKFILQVFLLLFVCSCSNNESKVPKKYVLKSSTEIRIVNDVVYFNKDRFSGYLFDIYPNKDTIAVEGFVDGKLEGNCKKWYPNKQLLEERYYSKGKKNGKQIAYWVNGKKRFEFMAVNDAYEGELREWTFDGKLSHLGHFKNGQEEGAQKLWYDTGKIRANYVIINGKRYGLLGTKNCKNVSDSIFSVK
ncbi:toxin-antitoxin system YwqK family antitoxin [Flavobacterium sp.]|uniref:toxin-antitoxin system YwqK family antitoxin n=1 Tax=Flavobacterium sp. TaxID=239 RepID=UPI0022CCF1E2|nr:toxin-antitoxin system YwqK family antitoxin [Flavobacterium sp.]MCZ8228750.1 toxin-antitoxin system YwqK family antitoxin [Flavobacterium sp.]